MSSSSETHADCDFIVVGSGAGGGTVAARLAEAGWRVVLLEAGSDPKLHPTGDPAGDPAGEAMPDPTLVAAADAIDDPMDGPTDGPMAVSRGGAIDAAALEAPDNGQSIARRRPDDYDVPAFHAAATEQTTKWDFFVRHYTDRARQARDPKYCTSASGASVDGVLYPRAGALGGCTAHGAMILLCPHNQDWDEIAELTGDRTWRAEAMRAYFEQLEDCRHRPGARLLRRFGLNRTRHGWHGWLRTEKAIPAAALDDRDLFGVLQQSAREAFLRAGQAWERRGWRLDAQGDPNDWRLVRANAAGLRYLPLSTRGHRRMGARERITETMALHPDRLRLELDALATRIIWDGNRAVGIEYLKGARLYRAAGPSRAASGEPRRLSARFDVILAGGAFNTPQLLMLSGIGPRETLEQHGIPVVQDLAGVGRNLQDRYEVSVVNRMNFARWHALRGATFAPGDPLHAQWSSRGRGFYGTNGAVLAVVRRSARARAVPDLCCFARLGLFKGYFPAYSALVPRHLNYLTWCVVKAHTNNRAGEVTLRSADPRDTPLINFRYFDEGSDTTGEDLESVVEGIRFSRLMMQPLVRRGLVAEEELPGPAVQSDDDLRQFVRDQAWGQDASCSCAIGPRDQGGVLTSDFRVHGTRGLRVVDASIFPRIPGFFIASAIYMAGEKAADVIGAQAKRGIAR